MYYLVATYAHPEIAGNSDELVRIYDNFEAAIEWGEIVAESEDLEKIVSWYLSELKKPHVLTGEFRTTTVEVWVKLRVAELSANIAELEFANKCIGYCMLHNMGEFCESRNMNAGAIFGACININDKNRAEILRLRNVFGV